MKTAPKVILLINDAADGGFATSILDSLQPNPNSSLQRSEDSFDLSLEKYGIKDSKASGSLVCFFDASGIPQVSILLLQKHEPPILACVLNEVLASLAGENASIMPSLILPFFLDSSKLKLESRKSSERFYGIQIGPETDVVQALVNKIQKAPLTMQIHHDPLSCVLQLVRVLKMPSLILIGQSGERGLQRTSGKEMEVICDIGERLASALSLRFVKEKVLWDPNKTSKGNEKEPWHALYG